MAQNTKKNSEYLVEVHDLKEYFPVKTGLFTSVPLKAVDGVSFTSRPAASFILTVSL